MSFSNEIISKLSNSGLPFIFDEQLSRHTSFQIGGPCDALIIPTDEKELISAINVCKDLHLPYYILGNGTNLLVSDRGVRGVIIKLKGGLSKIEVRENIIYAQAGALLSAVASTALTHSLSGLERLGGIPGTVGGGVYMNAGAYGSQISDVLIQSNYITPNGDFGSLDSNSHEFGYRKSIYTNSDKIILSATFELKKADPAQIKDEMSEYAKKRRDKQPLTQPNAGSIFKRPEGYFAGALIEDAGLKGFTVGGACVSPKHAGFIVNNGGAKAEDVTNLIEHIKEKVYQKSGVMLECEIKMLGDF